MLAPLTRRHQAQVARLLALALQPLLLGLGQCHEGLADRSFPVTSVGIVRRVRVQPTRRGRVWPIARPIVRPMLLQTGLLVLLLGANRVPLPLFLVAGLSLVRALLTWSALVCRDRASTRAAAGWPGALPISRWPCCSPSVWACSSPLSSPPSSRCPARPNPPPTGAFGMLAPTRASSATSSPFATNPWTYHLQHAFRGDWERVDVPTAAAPRCAAKAARRARNGIWTPKASRRRSRFFAPPARIRPVRTRPSPICRPICAALQAYELGRGSYRRVAAGLGVSTATAYRWVSQFGGSLVPVAALFGVVQSSGVVGIDEKWGQVPVPGRHDRNWMYVSVAVDAYTDDLLHSAIFPHVGTASAQAFLLALKTKGYRPQVIVTDLNQDYGAAIAAVFPLRQGFRCWVPGFRSSAAGTRA